MSMIQYMLDELHGTFEENYFPGNIFYKGPKSEEAEEGEEETRSERLKLNTRAALDELHKQEQFISADPANQEGEHGKLREVRTSQRVLYYPQRFG